MSTLLDWNELDAQWAWQTWTPSDENPWNQATVRHLLRRTGFGAGAQRVEEALTAGPTATLDRIFAASEDVAYESTAAAIAKSILAGGNLRQLSVGWLHRLLNTPDPLLEKMTLFWHGHFATGADKVNDIYAMHQQNETLRRHALGSFPKMVHEISKDPAMLVYLDSTHNRKAHPNENYARELMELFCMGEGNYSEKDVQELARCFTGWEVRRLQFRFNRFQHDTGEKSLLGTGNLEAGEEAIDVVLNHPATPKFIIGKLFKFFIADEPTPPDALMEPLVKQFRDDQLQIAPVLRRMLSSNLMFSDYSRNRKIRSPLEWILSWMKALDITGNMQALAEDLTQMGQSLYFPPNVKGWDGGRAWINSSTLVARANAVHRLVHDGNTRYDKKSIVEYAQATGKAKPEEWLNYLVQSNLTTAIAQKQSDALLESVKSYSAEQALKEITCRVATWPQTHLA
jgi:uncharacterized protein (DUF1800 family)